MMRFFTLLAFLPALAIADECRVVTVDDHDVLTIEAALNHATHLILPEPITKDVPGNTKLWVFAGEQGSPHYWVKPGDDTIEGESTSLTLLTYGRSYDFLLRRVEKAGALCVQINAPDTLGRGIIAAPAVPATQGPAAAPRSTRYRWKSDALEAVFDDGRYTYLRLADVPQGSELPIVSGGTKKAPELIEARYDALTRTYTVPGVHSRLVLTVAGKATAIEALP